MKYRPILTHLKEQKSSQCKMTFKQIEELIGDQLPDSAYRYREWWGNDQHHVQAKSWIDAGWKVDKVEGGWDGWVEFVKEEKA